VSRSDKGKPANYPQNHVGVQEGRDGVPRKQSVHCGLLTDHEIPYTCHRGRKHGGCHLDIDRDAWFDYYKGRWVVMPRTDDGTHGARGSYHGRHQSAMTTRRGQ
jgi:hypothetical protein